jgi:uncharacterized protein (DUF697 family)
MAYYDALVAKWSTLTPGTTAAKLAQLNAMTVTTSVPGKALLSPSAILNAIVFADLVALTQLQVSQLTLLLSGDTVDVSTGTSIRAGLVALFAGKTTTLANLAALVASIDAPVVPWWQATVAQGGGELRGPVALSDLLAAGGLV